MQIDALNQCHCWVEGKLGSCQTMIGEGGEGMVVEKEGCTSPGFQLTPDWDILRLG